MAKLRVLTNETSKSDLENTFSDLKKTLEKKLTNAQSELEVTDLLFDLNQILQTSEFDPRDERLIKSLRQRVYDKKRKIQSSQTLTQLNQNHNRNEVVNLSSMDVSMDKTNDKFQDPKNEQSVFVKPIEPSHRRGIKENLFKRFSDGGFDEIILEMIKKSPAILLFALCAVVTMWFVWKQSVPLYESTGFSDPKWCAFGALLMIAGFSVIHAMTRSKIVLLLCLYASTYEVVLIVDGTVKNETVLSQTQIDKNSEIVWLKEQAEHSGAIYKSINEKYENPSSKVFQNPWYKEKFVNPAWQTYSTDQKNLSNKIEKLSAVSSTWDRAGMLKILFRLGLVFLCMVSIHHLLKLFRVERRPSRANMCHNKTSMAYP